MKSIVVVIASLVAALPLAAFAGTGDIYVPAHRTANGLWVPANVPPSSGGSVPAKRVKGRPDPVLPPAATAEAAASGLPPILGTAKPIRR